MHHLPAWDSGPLDAGLAAAAGDQSVGMIDQEERAS